MKRDELIEILKMNWRPDEDVCFVWSEGGFGTDVGMVADKWGIYDQMYEVLENGRWVPWRNQAHAPWADFHYCRAHGHLNEMGSFGASQRWVRTAFDQMGTDFTKALKVCSILRSIDG